MGCSRTAGRGDAVTSGMPAERGIPWQRLAPGYHDRRLNVESEKISTELSKLPHALINIVISFVERVINRKFEPIN